MVHGNYEKWEASLFYILLFYRRSITSNFLLMGASLEDGAAKTALFLVKVKGSHFGKTYFMGLPHWHKDGRIIVITAFNQAIN